MAAFGAVVSEVGAAQMVGGNIAGQTRVLTTAAVLATSRGEFGLAIAFGLVLLLLAFAVNLVVMLAGQPRRDGRGSGAPHDSDERAVRRNVTVGQERARASGSLVRSAREVSPSAMMQPTLTRQQAAMIAATAVELPDPASTPANTTGASPAPMPAIW
jgi:hypothetical protein